MNDIAPLTPADEYLYHQIPDTFAATASSDRNWTEKIWFTAFAQDGSLQVNFGLGKYTNRNVMDAFGGVSRGKEQWIVRGSRELYPDPMTMSVGPLHYSVLEPLNAVRVVLEPNDSQPISFDLTFTGGFRPLFEERNTHRTVYRRTEDVVRYHQMGTASGWIEVDGTRHEVKDEEWKVARDHSWGERGERLVGGPAPGVEPTKVVAQKRYLLLWTPLLFERPDGSRYEIGMYVIEGGHHEHHDGPPRFMSGHVDHPDGTREKITRIDPQLSFDKKTRYFTGGYYDLELESGLKRRIDVEPIGETGFHMRPARYGSWKGARHGTWLGKLAVEGDYFPDCAADIRRLGQPRDTPVRAREGDAVGYGVQESIVSGVWPEFDLGTEADYGRGEGAGPEDR